MNYTHKKISIIVPVYKSEHYLHRCIDSILAQTYQNIEVVLIDDGSPDRSPQICDEYARKDDRIVVIHQKNQGVMAARKAGIEASSGELIGFVDSDDFIEQDMYAFLAKILQENQADIAQCGFDSRSESGEIRNMATGERLCCSGNDAVRRLLTNDMKWMVLWNKLYRRGNFQGVRLDWGLRCSEDALINYFLMRRATLIACEDITKYHYVRSSHSTLRQENQPYHILDHHRYLDVIQQEESENPDLQMEIRAAKVAGSITQAMNIVCSDRCWGYYDMLMDEISANKKFVFSSGLFRRQDKIKARLLLSNKQLARFIYINYRRLKK